MHPKIDFLGKLVFESLIENKYEGTSTSLFFSSGVDSFCSLYKHLKEKPILITLHGSDMTLEDEIGWNIVKNNVVEISRKFNLEKIFISSTFRTITNYMNLTDLVYEKSKDNYWHGFQHGIAIIGHLAPISYKYKIKTNYFASSFSIYDKNVVCASYPTIDNNVKFCSCDTIHDCFEMRRQDKIKYICDFSQENDIKTKLRVCWESIGGENCDICEKCIRTILAIYSEGKNPKDYGFNPDYKKIKKIFKKNNLWKNYRYVPMIKNIDNTFRKDKNVNWILKKHI